MSDPLLAKLLADRNCSLASPDPAIWIHLATESELASEAARIKERADRGVDMPLKGLTFAVKDNIDVVGWPTTAACPDFSYVATEDAPVVALLREAGAVPLGKTNLDQFATGLVGTRSPYGAVRNVFSKAHVSGGSSSGSAAAVARSQVDFALGTDTAGSGRVPASFGALWGLKPTRGLWSTRGVVPACRSLDCVSVLTRDPDLAETVWQILSQIDPSHAWSRSFPASSPSKLPSAFRFGIPRGGVPFLADPLWVPLWEQAIESLRARGGTPVEIDFAPFEETARLLYEGPWTAERWADLGGFVSSHPSSVHPVTKTILEKGQIPTASQAFTSLHRLRELQAQVEATFADIDLLALPTAGHLPTLEEVSCDPIGENSFLGRCTNFCNLLDLCAFAVPAGFDPRGLPFGITLFAPAYHDQVLIQAAHRLTDSPRSNGRMVLAVAGLHLRGEPLNHELTSRGGVLVRTTRTSSAYRCYRIVRGERRFPGLVRTENGAPVEVEIWSLPMAGAGSFLANCVRPPLCLGSLELEEGSTAMGFLCESWAVVGMEDITEWGSWRKSKNDNRTGDRSSPS